MGNSNRIYDILPEIKPRITPSVRDWSSRQRAGWWLKYIGMVAAAIISIATVAKMFGFTWNIQTKDESQAQYKELDNKFDNKLNKLTEKIDNRFNRFEFKIDEIRNHILYINSRKSHNRRGRNNE
jgi:hypothetical protein